MNQQRQHTVIRIATVLLLLSTAIPAQAQTSAFTYQGRLSDGGTAANGTYDLQFALFDSLAGGAQVGSTQTLSSVSVSAGIFSVSLDFGTGAFPGANRWLEIRTRLTGTPTFTTLSPRQQITSTPYAIRSLNASSADTVTVSGVPAGSGNYLQNAIAPQANANFNISGNGTAAGTLSANIVSAATQYNLGGDRILSKGSGSSSLFLGWSAGESNTTGGMNAFFGDAAGFSNTTGDSNAFFGMLTGFGNTTGGNNAFFGSNAGETNDAGAENAFFGYASGDSNTSGSSNTAVGARTGFGSGLLTNATAIGAAARVDQSNSMVLGSIAGINGATASVKVGIGTPSPLAALDTRGDMLVSGNFGLGTTTPRSRLHVVGSSWFQGDNTPLPPTAGKGIVMGFGGEQGYIQAFDYGAFTPKNLLLNNSGGNVGIGTATPQAALDVNGSALLRDGATVTGTNGDGAVVTARRPTGDPYIIIDATTVAQNSVLAFRKNNFNRWLLYTDGGAESGGNAGSDFRLDAYNNSGGIANYLSVTRATGNVGIGTPNPSEKLSVSGRLRLDQIDSGLGAGTVQLCRNAANVIATCTSSSLRYKQGITPFRGGLELIRGLRPISFTWKMDGSRDLGLGAEDVAKVEPLLVTHNDNGEIEGVRYDRLNVVLINAIKEQQKQIETLRAENAELNVRLKSVESYMRKRIRGRRK